MEEKNPIKKSIKRGPGRPRILAHRPLTTREKLIRHRMGKKEGGSRIMPVEELEQIEKYSAFEGEYEVRHFLDVLIKNKGKLVKSVKEAFPEMAYKGVEECYEYGLDVCKNSIVADGVLLHLQNQGITSDRIIDMAWKLAQDNFSKPSDKISALRFVAELRQLFGEKEDGTSKVNNLTINIGEDAARRLLERR